MNYIEEKYFEGVGSNAIQTGTYERCNFRQCNFKEANLSRCIFSECTFHDCDLSMAKTSGASFRDTLFVNCKLLGVRFDQCSKLLLSFSFENCTLNLSCFYRLKLKGTKFKNCKLHEVDFTESDLTNASFHDCDLENTLFENTILEGADFRTAYNFIFDPDMNKLKKARFSLHGLAGLLHKHQIIVE
jgi:fluoroquinolone resistance protein